jgi:hypothetical protein
MALLPGNLLICRVYAVGSIYVVYIRAWRAICMSDLMRASVITSCLQAAAYCLSFARIFALLAAALDRKAESSV